MLRYLLLCALLAQDVSVAKDIPPDLVHVEQPGCVLVQYATGIIFNAKTHDTEVIYKWRVEPYATYDDSRERWELPKETLPYSHVERPGALVGGLDDDFAALKVCREWRDKVKAAAVEARRKEPKGKKS